VFDIVIYDVYQSYFLFKNTSNNFFNYFPRQRRGFACWRRDFQLHFVVYNWVAFISEDDSWIWIVEVSKGIIEWKKNQLWKAVLLIIISGFRNVLTVVIQSIFCLKYIKIIFFKNYFWYQHIKTIWKYKTIILNKKN